MRKLFLNEKEYELQSGDVMVLEFDKVVLLGFRSVDSAGFMHKLRFRPNGDDKMIVALRNIDPQPFANFIAELIGFILAEEYQRTPDKTYFYLHK